MITKASRQNRCRPIVMKFGGSSVADADCFRAVGEVVLRALPRAPLVVLSATHKTTDELLHMARSAESGALAEALGERDRMLSRHRDLATELIAPSSCRPVLALLESVRDELERTLRGVHALGVIPRPNLDALLGVGERLSSFIMATYLDAEWFDVRTVLRTDAAFGAAQPDEAAILALVRTHLVGRLRPGRVVVTQGYVGATAQGQPTTLGRGGSDYSASLLGAALHAEDVQIWTDVEGVLTGDPRVVPDALPLPRLSFAEAAELAAFGAKVLHPATMQPAIEAGVPITVRHTRRPAGRFTTIADGMSSGRAVTALASRGPVNVVTVRSARMLNQSGFLARLFEIFSRHRISVDLIATAEIAVSLTVEPTIPLIEVERELAAFASVEVAAHRTIIAVVGDNLRHTPGIAGRCFGALAGINVEMISMGANEINLSLVVRDSDAPEAIRRLHQALITERTTP